MRYRPLALLITLGALLAGCMAPPAQRERQGQIDPVQACRSACNRAADVCTDQRSAQSTGPLSAPMDRGMTAVCNKELQQCLARCG